MVFGKIMDISPPLLVQNNVPAHSRGSIWDLLDPRYNDPEFRWAQAELYYAGKPTQLSSRERATIRFFCERELHQIHRRERAQILITIENIADRFLSFFPSDLLDSTRLVGINVVTTASIFLSAYTGDNRFIMAALSGYAVFLSREAYLKNFSNKGV